MLVLLFGVTLRWLPTSGYESWTYLILPSITLAAYPTALVARLTRSSMLEILSRDYIRTGRAKGLAERAVILRHALRNATIPVLTVIGLQIGALLGGAVITESVFAWPGMGKLVVDAIYFFSSTRRDVCRATRALPTRRHTGRLIHDARANGFAGCAGQNDLVARVAAVALVRQPPRINQCVHVALYCCTTRSISSTRSSSRKPDRSLAF